MTSDARPGAWRPADRAVRLVRSVAAALVCVLAAATGHLSAGGTLAPQAVVTVFGATTGVVWLLSSRRMTPGQLLGLLVLCQVCVHLSTADGEMTMGATMIAGHLVATAASAVLLARGEQFVWHLADRLALHLAPLLAVTLLVPSVPLLVPVVALRSRGDVRLAHSRWLRGPPQGIA